MNALPESARPRPALLNMVLMFLGTTLAPVGNYYIYDSIGPVAEQLSRELGLSGYISMLWFFGILSVIAFLSAALLWTRGERVAR